MAIRTHIPANELTAILRDYGIGEFLCAEPLAGGTVQTNILLQTSRLKAVLRLYENRAHDSVCFEVNLLTYLTKHGFPCPAPLTGR